MIRWFAVHPTAANLLLLVFVAIGLAALPGLQRETLPDFAAREIEVRVPYPGASAEDVEEAVCLRLEDAVDGVADLAEVRCESRESLGTLVAKMREGADFARFLDDVKTEVEAIDTFPEAAETPLIRQLGRTDQVVSVAVAGPMSAAHLKAYCRQLKDRLQQLPAVSQVAIVGFPEHHLRVEVPARILRQHGLSMTAVAGAIARQSVSLPAGSLETREREVLIRFDDERSDPQALADLRVVSGKTGAELRLGEIAEISDRFDPAEDKIYFNGRRAGILQVTKTKAEDTLTVVDAVKAFVAREQAAAPPGVTFRLTQDVSSIVRDRLQLLLTNGWQGLILVFLTLWLFFHLRLALWVAAGLPVAFLGALFFMGVIGHSINLISMVALLIALGLLMDDSIVIAENIATHLRQGKPALAAAVDGTRQVAPGVLASFLTTAAVFGPLAFLEGDIGKVLKVLPVVLLLVLAVSLVEAFFILPHHLAHGLHGVPASGRFRR
nr:efflux RND transporter permease subunit [Pseudomonadota bacterium]